MKNLATESTEDTESEDTGAKYSVSSVAEYNKNLMESAQIRLKLGSC